MLPRATGAHRAPVAPRTLPRISTCLSNMSTLFWKCKQYEHSFLELMDRARFRPVRGAVGARGAQGVYLGGARCYPAQLERTACL